MGRSPLTIAFRWAPYCAAPPTEVVGALQSGRCLQVVSSKPKPVEDRRPAFALGLLPLGRSPRVAVLRRRFPASRSRPKPLPRSVRASAVTPPPAGRNPLEPAIERLPSGRPHRTPALQPTSFRSDRSAPSRRPKSPFQPITSRSSRHLPQHRSPVSPARRDSLRPKPPSAVPSAFLRVPSTPNGSPLVPAVRRALRGSASGPRSVRVTAQLSPATVPRRAEARLDVVNRLVFAELRSGAEALPQWSVNWPSGRRV